MSCSTCSKWLPEQPLSLMSWNFPPHFMILPVLADSFKVLLTLSLNCVCVIFVFLCHFTVCDPCSFCINSPSKAHDNYTLCYLKIYCTHMVISFFFLFLDGKIYEVSFRKWQKANKITKASGCMGTKACRRTLSTTRSVF